MDTKREIVKQARLINTNLSDLQKIKIKQQMLEQVKQVLVSDIKPTADILYSLKIDLSDKKMEEFNSYKIVKNLYDEHVHWVEEMKSKLECGYAKTDQASAEFGQLKDIKFGEELVEARYQALKTYYQKKSTIDDL